MSVTPDKVLSFTAPTADYLCRPSENVYGIDFVYFRIKDAESGKVVFEIRKPDLPEGVTAAEPDDSDNSWRCIRYQFPKEFLTFQTVSTTLEFKVGNSGCPNFRMIERHYFRDRLVQSYDFKFGFCIPGSQNTWEAVYPMPELGDKTVKEMIANPYETKSDSFYFVDDKLIMHNKAEYSYI